MDAKLQKAPAAQLPYSAQSLLSRLSRPHRRITNAESQQNAKLLSWLLLTTIVIVSSIIVLVVVYDRDDLLDTRTLVGFSTIIISLVLYFINMAGYVRLATFAFITYLTVVFIATPYSGRFPEFSPFAVVPMFLAGMFYSFKQTALLVIGILAVFFTLNMIFIDEDVWDRRIFWYFLLFAGGLVLAIKYHLGTLEKIRQKRFDEVNAQREQQNLQLALEKERGEMFRTLVGSVAHDIKTPLAIINTSLYLLKTQDDPEKRKVKLDSIGEQVHTLDNFVQDLMEIARLESGPKLRLTRVNVNEIIIAIKEDHQSLIEKKRLTFVLDLWESLPPILADQADLRRALTNLVDNAINYTPTGNSVTVRTRQQVDDVLIEILDTGIGISETDLPHIFDRFYRSTEAQVHSRSGSGLGLTIVKRVAEMHEGTVEVTTALGKGSTFTLRLPTR
jgi:signal transduction histidine kinase